MFIRISFRMVLMLALFGCFSAYAQLETTCVGPVDSKVNLIYLHGDDYNTRYFQEDWMSPWMEGEHGLQKVSEAEQELQAEVHNRRVLEEISEVFHARIALPRSDYVRSDGLRMWENMRSVFQLRKTIPRILEARKQCFQEGLPFGVIGYSAGAIVISRWLSAAWFNEMEAQPSWGISVSGGGNAVPSSQRIADGEKRYITFILGLDDEVNRDPEFKTQARFQEAGLIVDQVNFQGGHEFPIDEIFQVLKSKLH